MSIMRAMSSLMSLMSPHYVPFWYYLESVMTGYYWVIGKGKAEKPPVRPPRISRVWALGW